MIYWYVLSDPSFKHRYSKVILPNRPRLLGLRDTCTPHMPLSAAAV